MNESEREGFEPSRLQESEAGKSCTQNELHGVDDRGCASLTHSLRKRILDAVSKLDEDALARLAEMLEGSVSATPPATDEGRVSD